MSLKEQSALSTAILQTEPTQPTLGRKVSKPENPRFRQQFIVIHELVVLANGVATG
jgi:hypothetical protein